MVTGDVLEMFSLRLANLDTNEQIENILFAVCRWFPRVKKKFSFVNFRLLHVSTRMNIDPHGSENFARSDISTI